MFWKKKSTDDANERIEKFFFNKGYVKMGDFSQEDIFIAGFPKSGNTWMQHLMTGMNFGTDMSQISNMLVRDLTPDVHQGAFYKRYQYRMVFKTHFLPKQEYRNVIFLVRDPRDAINSFYQMETSMGKQTTIAEIVKENKGLYCGWTQHVETWLENPHQSRIITVRYEELIENTFDVMKSINEGFNFNVDDKQISRIIENCSFAKMREKENSPLWGKNKAWKEGKYFVRKGKTGSFKEDLPDEDIRVIEEVNKAAMVKLNYS